MTTANQRLKERWPAFLIGSTILAAAVHVMVAWVTPPWEFPLLPSREQTVTFVPLVPVVAPPEFVDAEPNIAITSSPMAVQPEMGDPEKTSAEEVVESYPARIVPATSPLTRRLDAVRGRVQPRVDRSNLSGLVAPIAWPTISNRIRMTEYLRARYNPILAADGVTGMVVLSLSVDKRGVIERVRLMESSGSTLIDEIAVTTFREVVTFSPARIGPRALAVQLHLSVPFFTPW